MNLHVAMIPTYWDAGLGRGTPGQTVPPPHGAPAYRTRTMGEVEAPAGSCGLLKCWVWLPIGAGAGAVLGLSAVAVIRAVLRRRGGSR